MKLTQIFGIVVLIHLGIVGVLLIQPGCQSQPRATPDPTMTEVAPEAPAAEPRRPAPAARDARRGLDPAFNAGMEGTRDRAAPTRPPTRPTDDRPRTDPPRETGRLMPVIGTRDFDDTDDGPPEMEPTTHTVRRGDTLSGIARREGVSLGELLAANHLSRDATIYVGQEIRIPAGSRPEAAEPAARTEDMHTYTVVAGDNLTRIANRHGVTVAEIRRLNNLSSDTIRVGQTLLLPQVAGEPARREAARAPSPAPTPAEGQAYTVRAGDTPITIARRFGVEVDELMRVNNISDPRRLFVGRELVIPGTAPEAARGEPAPAPETRAARPREVTEAIPLRERPSQPAIIEQPPAERRAMTLDDLEALDDEELRYVEVEDADENDNDE